MNYALYKHPNYVWGRVNLTGGKKGGRHGYLLGGRVRDTDTLQISKALSLSFFEFFEHRKFIFPLSLFSFSLK